ncbi:MAG: ABC transporter permease, partial [Tissierellia bacterium]|nr:ABC transporter permease [Tissierellia bacterium]
YDRDLGKEEFKDYKIHLKNHDNVNSTEEIRLEQGIKRNTNGLNQSLLILVPEHEDDLKDYITLRNRKTKDPLKLTEEGAIITEKLSEVFDLEIGDYLSFENQYEEPKEVKITGITENYSNHFVYMLPKVYEEVYGEEYEKNADIVQLIDDDDTSILDESLKNPTVLSVISISSLANVMDQVIDSLNILVGVIIICAVVLAFVVLYNLNNINISERKNELSTIKVLGFYDNEVTRYIYRETFLLSLIGILFGFWVGKAMHWTILSILIPESLMLDPEIYLSTYILSFVITIVFLFIVMIIVHIKLRNIDMVGALKGE